MQAIFDAGLHISEDVAVVGCGGVLYNELLRVPLTSIDQNALLMGQEAANLAQRAIAERAGGLKRDPQTILLEPLLVVRESTAPGSGAKSAGQSRVTAGPQSGVPVAAHNPA
jgi:LacI family transcriptional regulator